MSLEGFQERIKATINGSSVNAFAKKCGIAESVVRSYLTGRSLPGLDKLYALANGGNVRVEWLASGEEPMRLEEKASGREIVLGKPAPQAGPETAFLVPHLDVEASAGFGTLDQKEMVVEHIAFKLEWLRNELGVSLDSIVLIRARGDSMEPTIRDGDLLLIDREQVLDRADGIYLLNVEERLLVKRVQFLLKGRIKVISDNAAYEPMHIDLSQDEEVKLLGRVVWFGKRV